MSEMCIVIRVYVTEHEDLTVFAAYCIEAWTVDQTLRVNYLLVFRRHITLRGSLSFKYQESTDRSVSLVKKKKKIPWSLYTSDAHYDKS